MLTRLWRRRDAEPVALVCYTRADCCLCDQAKVALDRLERRGRVVARYVSIAGDAELEARFGTRVPVVMIGERVLAEGKISEVRLSRALDEARRDG